MFVGFIFSRLNFYSKVKAKLACEESRLLLTVKLLFCIGMMALKRWAVSLYISQHDL